MMKDKIIEDLRQTIERLNKELDERIIYEHKLISVIEKLRNLNEYIN